ncbi:MAG: formylglycine-generating enzyme family protein [Deltaproteobacteria bacterium]|nr:formylglycine-generating enzyme family protein [Deltaproteobacteria bacterium]
MFGIKKWIFVTALFVMPTFSWCDEENKLGLANNALRNLEEIVLGPLPHEVAQKIIASKEDLKKLIVILGGADIFSDEDFVLIPATGEDGFLMGSEDGGSNERPVHKVELSAFSLQRTEVTQKQWKAVMGKLPDELVEYGKDNPNFMGDNLPIILISHDDAVEFTKKATEKSDQWKYALPTEAQWEYAAQAGSDGDYGRGQDEKEITTSNLRSYGWYYDESSKENGIHPVGVLAANAFGLKDMHGNVWEWVADWYKEDYYKNSPKSNPENKEVGSTRILRGGSWDFGAHVLRSAYRHYHWPDLRYNNLGFRLLRTKRIP